MCCNFNVRNLTKLGCGVSSAHESCNSAEFGAKTCTMLPRDVRIAWTYRTYRVLAPNTATTIGLTSCKQSDPVCTQFVMSFVSFRPRRPADHSVRRRDTRSQFRRSHEFWRQIGVLISLELKLERVSFERPSVPISLRCVLAPKICYIIGADERFIISTRRYCSLCVTQSSLCRRVWRQNG